VTPRPSIKDALEAFFEDAGDRNFGEWFEEKLKNAKVALEFSNALSKRGSPHRADLIEALARYDGADFNMRVTSGETLDHWSLERKSAGSDIEEMIEDLDPIDIARHVLFSPAF